MGVSSLLDQFPYVGMLLLLFLGEIGLPFPEDATLILSGFLIAQGVTKWVPTLLVVYVGCLITDFLIYWVGKKYGRKVVEHKRFRKIVSPQRLSKIEETFKRWGILVVLVGRHILGVRAQVFLAAGVMKMPPLKFVAVDAISAMFTVGIMVGIGYFGGNSIQMLSKDVRRVEHIVVVVLLFLITGLVFLTYFKKRNK